MICLSRFQISDEALKTIHISRDFEGHNALRIATMWLFILYQNPLPQVYFHPQSRNFFLPRVDVLCTQPLMVDGMTTQS